MISKKARQERIVTIIRRQNVASQEELSELLEREAVVVTQSTLSRDIRELGAVKSRGRYQVAAVRNSVPSPESVRWAFQQFLLRSEVSGNILMLRTPPGSAHSLGVVLDSIEWPEILGTVAGDDTVFVLLRNRHLGNKVLKRIREYSE
jgi:transcriptional regulator of arginine metabolism